MCTSLVSLEVLEAPERPVVLSGDSAQRLLVPKGQKRGCRWRLREVSTASKILKTERKLQGPGGRGIEEGRAEQGLALAVTASHQQCSSM